MMNTDSPLVDSAHDVDLAGAQILGSGAGADREGSEIFKDLLPRVVERIVGAGAPAQEALANGGFVLEDCTVVMRLNPETDEVEYFCDVGLPSAHGVEACLRRAMEMNLCRTYRGVTFGVHPESGRLVATTAMHAHQIASDDVCVTTLHRLTGVVSQLRHARTFDIVL